MKRAHLISICIGVLFSFFSCHSYRVIDIETYSPAAITFPPEIETILVINNSAQQPDLVGHQFHSTTKGDSTLSISVDSMAYFFCRSLGKAIAEAPVFDDVRLCEDTLRWDSVYYHVMPFSQADVESLCHDYDVNALISVDKLFYKTVTYEINYQNMYRQNYFRADIVGELRIFWPGQKEVYTLPFSDSLVWLLENDRIGLYEEMVKEVSLLEKKDAMRHLSEFSAEKIHESIVPYWTGDKRWYFTNIASEWKQGSAFAAAEKWEQAFEEWALLYEKEKRWKQKARLASNLALCKEMTGDFKKSIEYAELAYGLYKENAKEDDPQTEMQGLLLDALKKREKADRILSEQLHE